MDMLAPYYKIHTRSRILFPRSFVPDQYPLQTIFQFLLNTTAITEIRYGSQIKQKSNIVKKNIGDNVPSESASVPSENVQGSEEEDEDIDLDIGGDTYDDIDFEEEEEDGGSNQQGGKKDRLGQFILNAGITKSGDINMFSIAGHPDYFQGMEQAEVKKLVDKIKLLFRRRKSRERFRATQTFKRIVLMNNLSTECFIDYEEGTKGPFLYCQYTINSSKESQLLKELTSCLSRIVSKLKKPEIIEDRWKVFLYGQSYKHDLLLDYGLRMENKTGIFLNDAVFKKRESTIRFVVDERGVKGSISSKTLNAESDLFVKKHYIHKYHQRVLQRASNDQPSVEQERGDEEEYIQIYMNLPPRENIQSVMSLFVQWIEAYKNQEEGLQNDFIEQQTIQQNELGQTEEQFALSEGTLAPVKEFDPSGQQYYKVGDIPTYTRKCPLERRPALIEENVQFDPKIHLEGEFGLYGCESNPDFPYLQYNGSVPCCYQNKQSTENKQAPVHVITILTKILSDKQFGLIPNVSSILYTVLKKEYQVPETNIFRYGCGDDSRFMDCLGLYAQSRDTNEWKQNVEFKELDECLYYCELEMNHNIILFTSKGIALRNYPLRNLSTIIINKVSGGGSSERGSRGIYELITINREINISGFLDMEKLNRLVYRPSPSFRPLDCSAFNKDTSIVYIDENTLLVYMIQSGEDRIYLRTPVDMLFEFDKKFSVGPLILPVIRKIRAASYEDGIVDYRNCSLWNSQFVIYQQTPVNTPPPFFTLPTARRQDMVRSEVVEEAAWYRRKKYIAEMVSTVFTYFNSLGIGKVKGIAVHNNLGEQAISLQRIVSVDEFLSMFITEDGRFYVDEEFDPETRTSPMVNLHKYADIMKRNKNFKQLMFQEIQRFIVPTVKFN